MQLSVLHVFVENGHNGVLKLEIIREFHNLCIKSSVFKINATQKESINVFKSNLDSDPNNPKILDIIPVIFVYDEIYQLPMCEKILEYYDSFIDTKQDSYRVYLGNNLLCTLTRIQFQRVYNFFKSFVTNFALLDSIYSIYLNMLDVNTNKTIESKTEEKEITVQTPVPDLSLIKSVEKPLVSVEALADKKEKNIYEQILDYCLNNTIKFYVIHNILTYLFDISAPNKIKIINNSDNSKTILLTNLFNSNNISDHEFVINILNNNIKNLDENTFNFTQKKILNHIKHITINININNTINNPQDLNVLLILVFIYYLHLYRTIISKYPDFDSFLYFETNIQKSALNYFSKEYLENISFDTLEQDQQVIDNISDINTQIIDSLSEEYKHLIPISQEEFANIVFSKSLSEEKTNIKELQDFDLILSNKKILNISVLMSNQESIDKSNKQAYTFVNTTNYLSSNILLDYRKDIITKAYGYFKEYLNNPSSVFLIKDIPKEIINLFDFFSKSLHLLFNDKNNIYTLNYYKILQKNLPNPKAYSFETYLYIIYNIVIPYHFDTYKIDSFIDVFL